MIRFMNIFTPILKSNSKVNTGMIEMRITYLNIAISPNAIIRNSTKDINSEQ